MLHGRFLDTRLYPVSVVATSVPLAQMSAAYFAFYVKLDQLGIWIGLALSLVFASVPLVWRFLRLTHIKLNS